MTWLLLGLLGRIGSVSAQSLTIAQLEAEWDRYASKDAFYTKYKGQTLEVTGHLDIISTDRDYSTNQEFKLLELVVNEKSVLNRKITLDVRFPTNSVDAAALDRLAKGQPLTVRGTVNSFVLSGSLRMRMNGSQYRLSGAPAPEPMPQTKAAPADPPLGTYSVYQSDGRRFKFQYEFRLLDRNRYQLYDKVGTYRYNPATKVLRFITGSLTAFTGLYYTKGRNNDEGKPAIALSWDGQVPDLANAFGADLQYAYFNIP
ncbi:hypothetical protein [Tellurirhabdus rosea]|uniref:hypothetical protein n=1 Tax=Tellurirhabdus rosea TaxID=2674997 RepID=UPI00224F040A|nr:hypothetical protein [Tellurirhabdus rosea]